MAFFAPAMDGLILDELPADPLLGSSVVASSSTVPPGAELPAAACAVAGVDVLAIQLPFCSVVPRRHEGLHPDMMNALTLSATTVSGLAARPQFHSASSPWVRSGVCFLALLLPFFRDGRAGHFFLSARGR